MEIRCKRCFKKYDDSFPLCPRCGKESEYKASSNYNREYESYDSNEKKGKPNFIKNVIESYDTSKSDTTLDSNVESEYGYTSEVKDDILDEVWLHIAEAFNFLLKPFIKYRYCEFCGTKSKNSDYFCGVCKNGFKANYDESKSKDVSTHQQSIRRTIKEFVTTQSGYVDFESFIKVLDIYKFDFNNWNQDGEFKTGVRKSKYIAMGVYSFFLGWFLWIVSIDGKPYGAITGWFIAALILGNIFAIPLSKRVFSESITVNSHYVSVNNISRFKTEAYGTNPKNIKSIELIYNSDMDIENIIFRSKKGSDVSNLVFSLVVTLYANRESLVEYIMLFACKNDISIYVSKDDIDSEIVREDFDLQNVINQSNTSEIKAVADDKESKEKKRNREILFVRIDRKVDGTTLTELEYANHISYLNNISSKGYFMGGGFEKESGGMIVFSAIDEIDANKIAKDDPLIMSGAYTYELKEWNVVLRSNKNHVS